MGVLGGARGQSLSESNTTPTTPTPASPRWKAATPPPQGPWQPRPPRTMWTGEPQVPAAARSWTSPQQAGPESSRQVGGTAARWPSRVWGPRSILSHPAPAPPPPKGGQAGAQPRHVVVAAIRKGQDLLGGGGRCQGRSYRGGTTRRPSCPLEPSASCGLTEHEGQALSSPRSQCPLKGHTSHLETQRLGPLELVGWGWGRNECRGPRWF